MSNRIKSFATFLIIIDCLVKINYFPSHWDCHDILSYHEPRTCRMLGYKIGTFWEISKQYSMTSYLPTSNPLSKVPRRSSQSITLSTPIKLLLLLAVCFHINENTQLLIDLGILTPWRTSTMASWYHIHPTVSHRISNYQNLGCLHPIPPGPWTTIIHTYRTCFTSARAWSCRRNRHCDLEPLYLPPGPHHHQTSGPATAPEIIFNSRRGWIRGCHWCFWQNISQRRGYSCFL